METTKTETTKTAKPKAKKKAVQPVFTTADPSFQDPRLTAFNVYYSTGRVDRVYYTGPPEGLVDWVFARSDGTAITSIRSAQYGTEAIFTSEKYEGESRGIPLPDRSIEELRAWLARFESGPDRTKALDSLVTQVTRRVEKSEDWDAGPILTFLKEKGGGQRDLRCAHPLSGVERALKDE